MSNQFEQREDARLDYKFDWSDLVVNGDEISSFTLTPTGGITVDSDTIVDNGTAIQYFVSGGTAGVEATVTCEIVTNNALEDCRKSVFKIVECGGFILVSVSDVKSFCKTSLPDAAIEALICVVQDKMGECAQDAYSECVAKLVLTYAVCHLIESQKGGSTKSKRAANGASVTIEQYGTGEGLKSTPSVRLLLMIDSAGCYNQLFVSPLVFLSVGDAASPC